MGIKHDMGLIIPMPTTQDLFSLTSNPDSHIYTKRCCFETDNKTQLEYNTVNDKRRYSMSSVDVSVVITAHNRADLLSEAIDSVLAQSYSSFEIIIIDDGSTDDTPNVAKKYADKHPNIKLIQQENTGVNAARTIAASAATGEFIAFQDDDDISHPDRLKRQIEVMRANPNIAACVTDFAYIGSEQGVTRRVRSPWMWQGHALMIRREAYIKTGGFRSYFRVAGDADFFLVFIEQFDYFFIDEVLYYYRRYAPGRGDNITNTNPLKKFPYAIATFVSAHCRRSGLPDPVKENLPVEEIAKRAEELPADMRKRLLHVIRNSGRILLAKGEANQENLQMVRGYIDKLGKDECQQQATKYRRWLMLQCLRYRKFSSMPIFWDI